MVRRVATHIEQAEPLSRGHSHSFRTLGELGERGVRGVYFLEVY